MKKIILTESQSAKLGKMLKEDIEQMPVDKKMNKPYCINPDKVLTVKRYLDGGFTPHDFERVGADGFPEKVKVITMNASNGQPLKPMYQEQLVDLLIDKFQNMFLDKIEREMFMNQVVKDWLNNKISVHGMLSVNSLREGKLNEITSSDISAEAKDMNTNPTEKQKEAGNYKMAHISVKGMGISIENPIGSIRKWHDRNGKEGQITMKNHYGYFRNTSGNGKDGDAVDVFIGPHPEDFDKVYVIDQKIGGEFDESKVMIGFYSKEDAKDAYMSNYSEGWNGFWKITAVSLPTFKRWLYRDHKQRKPFFDYVTIKKHKIEEGRLNEEEYSEIAKIASMFDGKAAMEVAEELKAKGIDAYNSGNIVYARIERDRNCPSYVDEVIAIAKQVANEYMTTHSDSMKYSLNEDISISNLDVNGWHIARNEHGQANVLNTDNGKFASDTWYDWVSYPTEQGYVIVKDAARGYNVMNLEGKILLPKWYWDVYDCREPFQFKLLDEFEDEPRIIDIREYDK